MTTHFQFIATVDRMDDGRVAAVERTCPHDPCHLAIWRPGMVMDVVPSRAGALGRIRLQGDAPADEHAIHWPRETRRLMGGCIPAMLRDFGEQLRWFPMIAEIRVYISNAGDEAPAPAGEVRLRASRWVARHSLHELLEFPSPEQRMIHLSADSVGFFWSWVAGAGERPQRPDSGSAQFERWMSGLETWPGDGWALAGTIEGVMPQLPETAAVTVLALQHREVSQPQ